MITISANELKKKGVSVFSNTGTALVTVNSKIKYVVLSIEQYDVMREAELEMVIAQSKHDLANGKYVIESVANHIKRVSK